MSKKIVIVGGVAGGASCAARARRLDNEAEIVVLERGEYVSFSNCGLPYYLSREIEQKEKLTGRTPESFKERYNIEVRILNEVVRIVPGEKKVVVKNRKSGETYDESYDDLVLSPGAAPVRPPIPGIDREGHFTLRTVPDMSAIDEWIDRVSAKKAVVIGGGYIGLEVAEQLRERGMEVAIVEMLDQVMAPLDYEMAVWLHDEIRKHGIELILGDKAEKFEEPSGDARASSIRLESGREVPADVVVMGMGVKPDVKFLEGSGIKLGDVGGILVDEFLQTNQPNIWAAGDAVEARHRLTGRPVMLPLAGPANRQGRLIADNILLPEKKEYPGSLGTAILRVFSLAAAATGLNEKQLRDAGLPYDFLYLHTPHHVTYFPGAKVVHVKAIFNPETGKLWGAQVVGEEGVDKRIDVFATAICADLTVEEIAQLELAYAPPFGAAKDPVNFAGMVASNIRAGLVKHARWTEAEEADPEETFVLDVREPKEVEKDGAFEGTTNIPLGELRARMEEIPRNKEVLIHCASGQRSYNAARLLMQEGYRVRNLTGCWRTWDIVRKDRAERE